MKSYYVYILATKRNGILYVGVTNNPLRRIHEHKNGLVAGFTKQNHIKQLVYIESTPSIEDAIIREKEIKRWTRAKKIALIEEDNPFWHDLPVD
jgi:putative endonuclease